MSLNNINRATERIGARSPSTAGFSLMDGGRATMRFIIDEIILEYACNDLLGSAVPVGNGIRRELPAAHPQYPWLFCDRISNIEGLNFVEKYSSADPFFGVALEAPALDYYARYEKYEILAEFTSRGYPVLTDSRIPQQQLAYFDDTGAVVANKGYAEEWLRFTEIVYKPSAEFLTAVNGQMIFKTNAAIVGLQNQPVPGGQTRLLIKSQVLEVKWHCVPYTFIESRNSFIAYGQGRVNQRSWNGFAAGTLLYFGVNVDRIYTAPFPEFIPFQGATVPKQQKLCDITFQFLLRDQAPAQAYTTTNGSHIPNGHNLIFNARDGKWYYVENYLSGLPLYPSYPFELLFSNPDQ